MAPLSPKNLTAFASHRARGNPNSTTLESTISNCFPGLEFDFRNFWTRTFKGIQLHEILNSVLKIDEGHDDLTHLLNDELVQVIVGGETVALNIERSNAFSSLLRTSPGTMASCEFRSVPSSVDASSTWPGAGPPSSLLSQGTPWFSQLAAASQPQEIVFDMGLETTIERVLIRPFSSPPRFFPPAFSIEVSLDGNAWSEIHQQTSFTPDSGFNEFNITPSLGRYIRLLIPETVQATTEEGDVVFVVALDEVMIVAPNKQLDLEVRSIDLDGNLFDQLTGEEYAPIGQLTQSLCSPWQNDYRDCVCFYWAASRPDFVNNLENTSLGHNWMDRERPGGVMTPEYRSSPEITYQELFTDWENSDFLKFVVRGRDTE